jgi:hypothetical protein
MPDQKTDLTIEQFENYDTGPYYEAKQLRLDRPWAYDIIKVLWGRHEGATLKVIYRELRNARGPSALPKPDEVEATIRRSIYDHSSQAKD